jgi:hypothetical protein
VQAFLEFPGDPPYCRLPTDRLLPTAYSLLPASPRLTLAPFGETLASMQTLGLSGESRRSDGWLKSIFWPSVENAWDVDYLGQQGFWICVIVACVQLVFGLLSGNPIMMAIFFAMALVFFLGGMGVRQASWPAAALLFSVVFLNLLHSLALGQIPSVVAVAIAAVLLSNTRAAFLASQWRPASEDEDRPTRFNEDLRDLIVDQLPPKTWPVVQVPFYALASLLLLLSLFGIGAILWRRMGAISGSLHP